MSHPEYPVPCVEIMELVCILNVVRSAVFVVIFPLYSILFPPKISRTQIGYSFYGRTLTTMREYVTVRLNGIFLCATKRIVFVPFFTFPGNPSASRPNSFDNPFSRGLLFFIFLH